MTIINGCGEARSFPKPLTISSHTLRAIDTKVLSLPRRFILAIQSRIHSKEGRRFALLLARLNIPIIAINAITQIVVPPPKYMIDQLVPTARYRDTGRVRRIFIIGRGPDAEGGCRTPSYRPCTNTERHGFPPFSIMSEPLRCIKSESKRRHRSCVHFSRKYWRTFTNISVTVDMRISAGGWHSSAVIQPATNDLG
jgi:hypothetical protein